MRLWKTPEPSHRLPAPTPGQPGLRGKGGWVDTLPCYRTLCAAGEGAAGIAAVVLQDAVVASSAAVARVRAPRLRLRLSRADLAALWHLADALAAWRAAYTPPPPAALPPPVQAAVLVDAGLSCSLQQARLHPNPSRSPPHASERLRPNPGVICMPPATHNQHRWLLRSLRIGPVRNIP